MADKKEGLIGNVLKKIALSLTESGEEKIKRNVAALFPSVPEYDLERFMGNPVTDTTLTYRENLIKAVLEGIGPTAYEAHVDHPDRDVRFIAQSLAYGSPVKSVRFDE